MKLKLLSLRRRDRKRRCSPAWYLCMSHSIDWRELIPPTAGGLFLTWVKFFSKVDLRPLAHWTDTAEVVSFLVAGGGLLVATFWLKQKPVLYFVIGVIVLLVFVLTYLWFSSTPPPAAYWLLSLYDVGAIVTYWGSYFVYGFCAARLCRFIVLRRP